jgi:hypothetical protein
LTQVAASMAARFGLSGSRTGSWVASDALSNRRPDPLANAAPPWILKLANPAAHAYELAWRLQARDVVSRVLRGSKMQNQAQLFDEIGAALQLPDYFGENWPALAECLTDLSWMPGKAYAVIILNADRVRGRGARQAGSLPRHPL